MKRLGAFVAIGGLMAASSVLVADQTPSAEDCLFAVNVGGRMLLPCADEDPLDFGSDVKLRSAMQALEVPADRIKFKGCTGQIFATYVDDSTNSEYKYIVTYPSEMPEDYLAPVVHELAHVMQLEAAGGSKERVRSARDNSSLRVELEADYLTGMVLAQALKADSVVAFQHNKTFVGMFKEAQYHAHGTPSQRTSAFRQGYYQAINEDLPNIEVAALHFQANVYAGIARSR